MEAFIFLMIWIIMGLIPAAFAHHKNRYVLGWFLGGFFFGPLAWVIVLLPPKKKELDAEMLAEALKLVKEK